MKLIGFLITNIVLSTGERVIARMVAGDESAAARDNCAAAHLCRAVAASRCCQRHYVQSKLIKLFIGN